MLDVKPTAGTAATIDVRPVAGRIGAQVLGIDFSNPIDPAQATEIWRALGVHKVLFFRGADLDDEGQEAFARALGDPVPHPTIVPFGPSPHLMELDSIYGSKTNSWHTDVTFVPDYPAATMLRAVTVPDHGGDTVWANTATAYLDLPPSLRALADELRALHSNLVDYAIAPPLTSDEDDSNYARLTAKTYRTEHPLVRVHPATGERTLVLGHFVQKIQGVKAADSVRLFQTFQEYITRLENTVRWRWQAGDIAIWDNRATQHYAINDYAAARRIMRRITLAGDVPVGLNGRESRAL